MKAHVLGIAVVLASALAGGVFASAACTSFSSEEAPDDSGTESGPVTLDADLGPDGAPADAADARPPREDAADGSEGPMFVFVSSQTRLGDMGGGGRAGADALCQNLGNKFKVGRKWIAWLSLDGSATGASARSRLPSVTPEYQLVDGTRVLAAGAAFTGTGLEHAIDRDETSMPVDNVVPVWTGTAAEGTFQSTNGNCANWTKATGPEGGGVGAPTFKNFNWTEKTGQLCGLPGRVYCFEIKAQ